MFYFFKISAMYKAFVLKNASKLLENAVSAMKMFLRYPQSWGLTFFYKRKCVYQEFRHVCTCDDDYTKYFYLKLYK